MNIALHIKICGALLILLAALHPAFARRFRWQTELASVSLFTREVFWIHTLCICVVLVQFGFVSLVFADALLERTLLGKLILAAFVSFWGLRCVVQHFGYSTALWRGNRFNTVVHVIFSAFWFYLVVVYGVALVKQF